MARAADLMKYNTLLGVKGINIRNTFIEFEEEDTLGDLDVDAKGGFGRQASEPAKPSNWNRQVSEQTTAMTAEGTEDKMTESAIDADEPMHLLPTDFQVQGDATFLDAIKAVNQAVSNMTQMTQSAMMTGLQTPPKPQLRFCPSCGAKVISQAHRFCAYCCFPFSQLQDETVPQQQQMPILGSLPMNNCPMDSMEQALLANMQAANAAMPQPTGKPKGRANQPSGDESLLSNLRHFRYVESKQLDVELARVLCLTHIRDSIQIAA